LNKELDYFWFATAISFVNFEDSDKTDY